MGSAHAGYAPRSIGGSRRATPPVRRVPDSLPSALARPGLRAYIRSS